MLASIKHRTSATSARDKRERPLAAIFICATLLELLISSAAVAEVALDDDDKRVKALGCFRHRVIGVLLRLSRAFLCLRKFRYVRVCTFLRFSEPYLSLRATRSKT